MGIVIDANDKSIFGFINGLLPHTVGYGDTDSKLDDDGIYDHTVWTQTIREDHEGDVGIFQINEGEDNHLMFQTIREANMQVVVNCVNGNIVEAMEYLRALYENIKSSSGNVYVSLFDYKLTNISPVGKHSSGIQWCVLNILLKYINK